MSKEVEQYRFVSGDFQKLKLNTSIPGRIEWWNKVMKALDADDAFVLKLNSRANIGDNAGGGYHWSKGVNFIDIPFKEGILANEPIVVKDNVVTFPNDKVFACFVHEIQHFYHLSHDHGLCMSPAAEGEYNEDVWEREDDLTPELVRLSEYEASYRSIFYGKMYRMFPGSTVNFVTQMTNMLMNDIQLQPELAEKINEEFKKEYKDVDPTENYELYTKFIKDNIIMKVKSITSWADPNHSIPLIKE